VERTTFILLVKQKHFLRQYAFSTPLILVDVDVKFICTDIVKKFPAFFFFSKCKLQLTVLMVSNCMMI